MNVLVLKAIHRKLVSAVIRAEPLELPAWRFDGKAVTTPEEVASALSIPLSEAKARMDIGVPGWEGSVGPFPHQYGGRHVYARDVHSGAGNCVCGRHNEHRIHQVKDVYGASGASASAYGVGTVRNRTTISQRADALASGRRRRRKREKKR